MQAWMKALVEIQYLVQSNRIRLLYSQQPLILNLTLRITQNHLLPTMNTNDSQGGMTSHQWSRHIFNFYNNRCPPVEYDIGRLLESHANLSHLSRSEIYHVLTTEPDSNPSSYLRTRPCRSSLFRQFQPSWVGKQLIIHDYEWEN